jgi:hypothetical protein
MIVQQQIQQPVQDIGVDKVRNGFDVALQNLNRQDSIAPAVLTSVDAIRNRIMRATNTLFQGMKQLELAQMKQHPIRLWIIRCRLCKPTQICVGFIEFVVLQTLHKI